MKPPLKQNRPDDYQTPQEAIYPLLPFIPKDWVVWECAEGQGNLKRAFKSEGYSVIGSDILTGHDFLKYEPETHYDVIITNPPYKYKQQFLERAYSLGKPFAFLLPLTTFETRKRQALFKKYGVQVIFFDKRINFTTPTGKSGKNSSSWFATAWFSNGLNLPQDLNFVEYGKRNALNQRDLTDFDIH